MRSHARHHLGKLVILLAFGIGAYMFLNRLLPVNRHAAERDEAVAAVVAQETMAHARAPGRVVMHEFRTRELRTTAFSLERPAEVRIEATGAEPRGLEDFYRVRQTFVKVVGVLLETERENSQDPWTANAWILDARTREVVWELAAVPAEPHGPGLRTFSGTVQLPAGDYEVHYSAFPGGTGNFDLDEADQLSLRLEAEDLHPIAPERALEAFDADIRVASAAKGYGYARTGFVLDRPAELDVRMMGEATRSQKMDYGWIQNADTREMVWSFDYARSSPAGGSTRNRLQMERIELPAGRYVAQYVQSASHGPGGWNAAPPWDPSLWGMSLRAVDPEVRSALGTFEYSPVSEDDAVVAITQVRNDERRAVGFTLKAPLEVRIYALGESSGSRMSDYARLVKARTYSPVWTMEYSDTRHAGGSTKNRLYEGTLRLEPGDYVLQYAADDSHAYGDWNASEPFDPALWGVTLSAVGSFDRSTIEEYDEANDPRLIVRMTGVRDGQQLRRSIRIEQDTEVAIYALGESSGGEMSDGARITDDVGRTVWTMRYDETQHAGGSNRNRVYHGVVRLSPGEYEVNYFTDSSHAYGRWNSTPPNDPESWGITIYRAR
jgi:hypothetical protein